MTSLAYQTAAEFWVLMGLLATSLFKIVTDWNRSRQARFDKAAQSLADEALRESARKDLLLVASIAKTDREAVEEKLKQLELSGNNRLKTMLQSNATTRLYTKKAVDTANHVTEKFNTLTQALVNGQHTTQKVEIINPPENPVNVTETHPQ